MKTKILIADDREVNRTLLRACFEPLGYEVSACASASEALREAQLNRPNLIISDIHMDPISGILLCKYMKQDPELRKVPFMLFSASYPSSQEIEDAHTAGAECCLSRPIEPKDLIARAQACLAHTCTDRAV